MALLECPYSTSPAISIQCNWNDVIKSPHAELWVSCKFKGENSFHGKISGSRESVTSSDGFSVTLAPEVRGITVRHIKTDCTYLFVAPGSEFSGIHKKSVVSLDTTGGGLAVSACKQNELHVWDTNTGLIRRTLQGHPCDVYRCRFFPSGVVVLSGGADMQVKIWSAETGQCPVTLRGHSGSITDVAIVDRGRNVISVSKDGTARLWDCGKSECLGILTELPAVINCCAITAVSNKVPLGEPDNPTSDREVATEDKVLLVGCEDGILSTIAVRSRKVISKIALPSAVNCITSVNEETVAVGCQDGQVILFNPADLRKPYRAWHESNSPALSLQPLANGLFVGRCDGTCTYLPFQDLKEPPRRIQLTGPEYDPIYDISYNGNALFTACRDGIIRKYDISKPIRYFFHEI